MQPEQPVVASRGRIKTATLTKLPRRLEFADPQELALRQAAGAVAVEQLDELRREALGRRDHRRHLARAVARLAHAARHRAERVERRVDLLGGHLARVVLVEDLQHHRVQRLQRAAWAAAGLGQRLQREEEPGKHESHVAWVRRGCSVWLIL